MSTDRKRWPIGLSLVLSWLLSACSTASAYPVKFADSARRQIVVDRAPRRVVSLVPSVTDAIFAIGAGDALVGVTYHDNLPAASRVEIVGGFAKPSLTAIERLEPDLVFATSYQAMRLEPLVAKGLELVVFDDTSLEEMYRRITILGRVLDRRVQAEELNRHVKRSLQHVARKTKTIPAGERRRVIRLMGRDTPMTPGDDSFQLDLIRAAGGIPPELGKNGAVLDLSLGQWRSFDPQVIYYCEGDEVIVDRLRDEEGWRDVEAFRESRIYRFPCDLTCRTTPRTAEFIPWLASTIYPEHFGAGGETLAADRVTGRREIEIPIEYVADAAVVDSTIFDFENNTLLIDLDPPMRVLSSLEGEREGIRAIANHHTPPPCWGALHDLGSEGYGERVLAALERDGVDTSLLFTGADLANLSVRSETHEDLTAHALVTAGVAGNAMRASVDEGSFYEPGTINVILMTNARLTPRAMARAIISATEAKTAALQDLDVRSSFDPRQQATGTGTDNVLVVEGRGDHTIEGTGGHCKLGELISKAVYGAVVEAIELQNGFYAGRPVLRRLRERGLTPGDVSRALLTGEAQHAFVAAAELEHLLLEPRYASFIEASLALSDAHERGQVEDLSAHRDLCRSIAEELADGSEIPSAGLAPADQLPAVLRMSFGALLEGLAGAGRIQLGSNQPADEADGH